MPLRVLACDDEPLALARIGELLSARPETELVAAIRDAQQAVQRILELRPDVILLDIEMPRLNGFDILDAMRGAVGTDYCPQVIIISAHPEFAAEAFEAEVFDFLAKPVRYARLDRALARAQHQIQALCAERRLEALAHELNILRRRNEAAPVEPGALWIKVRGESVRVPFSTIRRITAEGEYVRLHSDQADFLHREPLGSIVERLKGEGFVRIHRSAAVRIDAIAGIARALHGGARVRLADGTQLPVGRRYRRDLEARLARRGTPAEQD